MKIINSFALLVLLLILPASANCQTLDSGLAIGTDCPAFDPQHVSGPDKGTKACPMCKYGKDQGVMIWVNDDDMQALGSIAKRLETEIAGRGLRKFRAFIMYMNPNQKPLSEVRKTFSEFAASQKLTYLAVTYIPSPNDADTAALFEINPDRKVRNTVLIYKKRKVVGKMINLDPDQLSSLMSTCDNLFSGQSF